MFDWGVGEIKAAPLGSLTTGGRHGRMLLNPFMISVRGEKLICSF